MEKRESEKFSEKIEGKVEWKISAQVNLTKLLTNLKFIKWSSFSAVSPVSYLSIAVETNGKAFDVKISPKSITDFVT